MVHYFQVSRNTRGSYFSMRNKKQRETLQQQINPLQWLLQQNTDLQIQEPKVKSLHIK